jgi:Holliday junction resolvasome RuvABC endonuclease subunit
VTLYCDPSARAFGWFLFDGNQPVASGCWNLLEGISKQYSSATKSRHITINLADNLYCLIEEYSFDKLVTELPTGSQSSNVAWYLSAIQSTLLTWCQIRKIKYTGLSESEIKKAMHGRCKNVKKDDTIKFVLDNYPQFSYIIQDRNTKPEKEALADAIAVYHAHQKG